ncbi:MAG: PAS domain S-box protein [Thermodesulfobacteriota bacterium]
MKSKLDKRQNSLTVDDFVKEVVAIREEIHQLRESQATWKSEAERLRKCNDENKGLIENLPQKICLKDRNSVYLFCNKKFSEDLKIKSGDVAGKTDFDLYPEEIAARNQADDQRVMEKGEPEEIEDKCASEGGEAYLRKIKVPLKNEDGKIIGILDVIADNKEKKLLETIKEQTVKYENLEHALRNTQQCADSKEKTLLETIKEQTVKYENLEHALRSTQQCYDYVLDNAPMGIWISIGERIEFVNSKGAEILGYSRKELISKPFKELLHPEYQKVLEQNNGNSSNYGEKPEINPLALVHKDGTQKWVEYKTSLISWEEKPAIIFYGKDITNQKKMEESLKNSIKQLRTIANSMEESFGGTSGAAETLPHSLAKNNPSKERARVKKPGRGSDHPPKVPADVIV